MDRLPLFIFIGTGGLPFTFSARWMGLLAVRSAFRASVRRLIGQNFFIEWLPVAHVVTVAIPAWLGRGEKDELVVAHPLLDGPVPGHLLARKAPMIGYEAVVGRLQLGVHK